MPTTYWANGDSGNDANDGLSSSTPVRTLDYLTNNLLAGTTDGDIIRLKGTFREQLKIGSFVAPGIGCTITDWGDGTGYTVRGDTVVAAASWTYGGAAGVFTAAIAAGVCHYNSNRTLKEGIATVVVDWDTASDPQGLGRPIGHLTRATSASNCVATADTWWFDDTAGSVAAGTYSAGAKVAGTSQDGSGTLIINLAEGYTSNAAAGFVAKTIAYVVANTNGIEVGTQRYKDNQFSQGDPVADNPNGTRSWTIENGSVYLFADSGWRSEYGVTALGVDVGATKKYNTNSMGYGIRPSDFTNGTVRNMTVKDCGYHGIMFVGSRCNGNVMSNCTIWGGSPNPISGNSIGGAFYCSDTGSWDHNIYGCRAYNVTLYKYTHLGRDGNPVQFPFDNAVNSTGALHAGYAYANTDGFICHTNVAAGNDVTDIEYHGCRVIESGHSDGTKCTGSAFIGGNASGSTVTPSDPWNASTYRVRFYDCTLTGGIYNRTNSELSCAYVRCRFSMDRHGLGGDTTGALGSGSGTQYLLFDSCEIVDTMGNASASARLTINCSTTNKVYMLNCSVYGIGTATNSKYFFNFLSGVSGSRLSARGCVFGYKSDVGGTKQLLTMGVSPSASELNQTVFDMEGCLYFGPSGYIPIGFPGPNSFAAWKSTWDGTGIDQTGTDNGTTSVYADSTGATLAPTAAAKLQKLLTTPHTTTGINLRLYSQQFGAYQYGSGGHRLPRAPRAFRLKRV